MQCEISRQFFELLDRIAAEQKTPLKCGGQLLYRAELELLEQIQSYPDSNVSTLSLKAGITKSALTQTGLKLLEKGLIEKYQSPQNKKEKYFRLTAAGLETLRHCADCNRKASEALCAYLCSLTAEEKQVLIKFMEMMQLCLPLYAFPCRCTALEGAYLPAEDGKGKEQKC